uniref:Ammonium transporter AmtB-like domain-containing protein n=1 Tax=Arcella intermedia TaxID=1963864 RepID=A0A6B2LII4_9EUKA
MFAIITVAIFSGGVAERMKFGTYLLFLLLWTTLVYDPVAHWAWSAYEVTAPNGEVSVEYGWMRKLGAIDFAGGTVVHITSGFSALAASIVVGPRPELRLAQSKKPHNVPYILLGGGLLWFGWFGFNAGSALAAGPLAALAFANTHVAAAVAMTTWIVMDVVSHKHASAVCGGGRARTDAGRRGRYAGPWWASSQSRHALAMCTYRAASR